ncbi:MAG: alpha-amylase/pullulanase [Propionibacteriaceae bacterium]|nr:alpha-amylase/pullulanase [Propionibacteriaceae bacterium]
MFRRSWIALVATLALLVPISATTMPATAEPGDRTVTFVGTAQDELGCPGDWQPDCTATDLVEDPGGGTYSQTFRLPAGAYEYKVAIDHSWDESYLPDGSISGDNGKLALQGPASVRVSFDDTTHKTTITPTDLPGPEVSAADRALAGSSLRAGLTKERFYFLMADRFADGSKANDAGGLTGGRMETGFDPTDKGFYHGGDLVGVTRHLDYIKGLGTTAIWLTPSFKNRPVQGSGADASAGYHGYWITDFTQIDPHLGTNEDMLQLIDAAHSKGMKVFFDIITNHTADVISYDAATPYTYRNKADFPYRKADGTTFDDRDYVNKPFPTVDVDNSFPYQPRFATPADARVKVPAWLNDRTLYHNRGDTTYVGENSTYGDFSGLDDLFTENPTVVDGMTKIYKTWVDLGIDGFRIDTVKHVNTEFWQKFSPDLLQHADDTGRDDFFMFGEVFDANPAFMSTYTTTGKLQATLDFGFQDAAQKFAQGQSSQTLRDLYAGDDYYTDTDSNAYQLPTFLGNHDMGRASMMLTRAGFSGEERVKRLTLANQLMYLTRGQPVVYYGDEQGFIGAGGDKDARQDMFATKTAQYQSEPNLFADVSGSKDRYQTSTPLYQSIKKMAALRAAHPTLADGAQIQRYATPSAGIFAVSRIDPKDRIEYIVAVNNSTETKTADFETYSARMGFKQVSGAAKPVMSRRDGRVTVSVPPLSTSVWKANHRVVGSATAPAVYAAAPGNGADYTGRAEIAASLSRDDFAQLTFAWRPAGTSKWTALGTDDNVPYRVFHDVSALPAGTLVEYRTVAKDIRGQLSATSSSGIVGTKGAAKADPVVGPVAQPDNVSVPGDHNSEMGCPGDWQPECDQAQLTRDDKDDIWKGAYTLPAGGHAYKVAINKKWDENYGDGGALNGGNIGYTAPGSALTFYYDHRTHNIANTAQGPLITAAGSFQSEQGCPGDWDPSCMRAWLGDPDKDGVFTWTGTGIPRGDYEFKIAHNLSWDENYGDKGTPGGDNIKFSVPADGLTVQFRYASGSHVPTVVVSEPASSADLTKAKAYWVSPGLLAWPADSVPAGIQPATLRWRLHGSGAGGMTVDAERINSDKTYNLSYDRRGLPAAVVAAHPQLKGYLALRFSGHRTALVKRLLKGQVAVGLYTDQHKIIDGTGIQIASVLDAVYPTADRAAYGITWKRSRPEARIWAPTAQRVTLLTWPADAAADAPVAAARRTALKPRADGSWNRRSRALRSGTRYLFEVQVFQPRTQKVETSLVTDPYSVALTVNSTRSVAVDLSDKAFMPRVWRRTAAPTLARGVDSTIYELHVRDFSVNDSSVPAAHRGSYLAFNDRLGNGSKHLRALAKAGLNTVHLLPTFDIASIPEDPAKQQTPDCDLASYAPDSDQQQACVGAVAGEDAFNWGYDPWHWMAPEGSYASSAAAADGGTRVAEFRTMVGGLHKAGLRVVLDQVYNHTPTSGQAPTSVLDKMVPGYYQRLNAVGEVETSTCCQNVATENAMAQKIMVDSVVVWARDYRVDGFRFDLMGHHSKENMLAVRAALDELTLKKDGVDGKSIYLYGEGWNFGEVANNARFTQATQGQLGGTGIGTFSDRLRDAVRGGSPFDADPRNQGLGTGLLTDPNASDQPDAAARLKNYTDLAQLGLAGNLRSFTFTSAAGQQVRGDEVNYNGSKAGYADEPDEVISYVDAHDNETLFDELTYKLPVSTSMSDRVRMNTLALSMTALSQTPSFWHAGSDLLRSKSLDRNSYNSGDWFNTLDWTGADNGFGHGLPPRADNESKWTFQKPLLANRALKPNATQVRTASARSQELLKLRFSTPLFRLGSAELINQKVSFPVSGTAQAHDGVIAMRVDDTVGPDVDSSIKNLVVVFNTTPEQVDQVVPGLGGKRLVLSPVQASGGDPVVKRARWESKTATLTIPARTVAVFVQR